MGRRKKEDVLKEPAAETAKKPRKKPKVYKSVDELEEVIEGYFHDCDEKGILYSEAGLYLALDVDRSTVDKWMNGSTAREEFQYPMRKAYLRMEMQLHTHPVYQTKGMTSMAMFKMKQEKFGGYQDKIEAKQDIAVNVKMGAGMDESDFG